MPERYCYAAARDITGRKQAEEARRQENKRRPLQSGITREIPDIPCPTITGSGRAGYRSRVGDSGAVRGMTPGRKDTGIED